jgi:2-polyprenyl-6-methoxyphenol hydroxylase-like FAD-dependent oxidoreductase
MKTDTDVLIVGAGPVGLTLANDLAARGVPFRIIDLLAEPTRNSRAHGLQSRTLEELDALGLAEPLLAAAQHPQPAFLILSGQKTVARIDFSRFHHEPFPYQLVIWQQRVERVLQTALEQRGHSVERSTRLLTFEMDEEGVTAHVERGNGHQDTLRAAWIVGCDGGRSTVRETLGLKMHGTTIPHNFMLGEFDIHWNRSRDAMYEWWHKDGMVSATYIDFTNKWHIIVEYTESQHESPSLDWMQALFRKRTGDPDVELSNPAWISEATFHQAMPDRFIEGRAILAGDAAHVHSAAGGQGMNTGIQDALNLGWKLALTASGAASPTLLQTYGSERLPNARSVLRTTQRYHRIELPHGALAQWLAGTFFRALGTVGPFGNAVAERVGMLDISYPDSPLSRQESPQATRRTRAGCHVPDAPCRLGGCATRLFEILRGTQAHLLLFAGFAPTPETVRALRAIRQRIGPLDTHLRPHFVFASETDAGDAGVSDAHVITDGGEYLQTAFGMREPEILYVRPDGYIGLRTQNLDGAALSAYLGRIYAGVKQDHEAMQPANSPGRGSGSRRSAGVRKRAA